MIKNKIKKQAFTLVELIVVIAILAILGTLSFFSYQGYTKSTRDSTRITDVSTMKTGLELFFVDGGKYPTPVSSSKIVYSGSLEIWSQGLFGESLLSNIGRINKIPVDPITGKEYSYSVLSSKKKYEIGTVLENGLSINNEGLLNKSYAANLEGIAYVEGTYNGFVDKFTTGSNCYLLTIPSIITNDLSNTNIENIMGSGKLVYNGYKNLPASFQGTKFKLNGGFDFKPTDILAYHDNDNCNALITDANKRDEALANVQTIYGNTILVNDKNIFGNLQLNISEKSGDTKFCSMLGLDCKNIGTATGGLTPVTIIGGNNSGNNNGGPPIGCATQPNIQNAIFSYGTPSMVLQVRNFGGGGACNWICESGYNKGIADTCEIATDVLRSGNISTDWNTPGNWITGSVPGISDNVIINGGTNQPIINLSSGDLTIGSLSLGETNNSTLSLSNSIVNKLIVTSDINIYSKGTLTHITNTSNEVSKLFVTVNGNLTINSGGKIDVTGKGYKGGNTLGCSGEKGEPSLSGGGNGGGIGASGAYQGGGGGGHIGVGGKGGSGPTNSTGIAFGDIFSLGGGGGGGGGACGSAGNGSYGGGSIKLLVGGNSIINGDILAKGANGGNGNTYGGGGGGAGGSILISTNSISGNANISANGGNGGVASGTSFQSGGGAGGGGAITIMAVNDSYTGTKTVNGGTATSGGTSGTVGSILYHIGSLIDNTTNIFNLSGTYHNLTISGINNINISGNTTIDNLVLDNSKITNNDKTLTINSSFKISNNSEYIAGSTSIFDASTVDVEFLSGNIYWNIAKDIAILPKVKSLVVFNTAVGTNSGNGTSHINSFLVDIINDLTINSGGKIDVTGKGYKGGNTLGCTGQNGEPSLSGLGNGGGIGASASYQGGGGGGHIGVGGKGGSGPTNSTGIAFGDIFSLGGGGGGGGGSCASAGNGGYGGGTIKLLVGGNSIVNGDILAKGANGGNGNTYGGGGGGAGGSIWINTNSISGNANISANGGNGGVASGTSFQSGGGAGGGGAITIMAVNDSYTGTKTVNGGTATSGGTSGTVGSILYHIGSLIDNTTNIFNLSGTYHNLTISGINNINISGNTTIDNLVLDNSKITNNDKTLTINSSFKISNNSEYIAGSTSIFDASTVDVEFLSGNIYWNIAKDIAILPKVKSLVVFNTAVGTNSGNGTSHINSFLVDIINDLTINSGGKIDVTGKGYKGGNTLGCTGQNGEPSLSGLGNGGGIGASASYQGGGGGGHIGVGGKGGSGPTNSTGIAFGDIFSLGGGGGGGGGSCASAGNGGYGGGTIKLLVGGNSIINGDILAKGANGGNGNTYGGGGGGAGGSIWINTNSISGNANISTNGGNGGSAPGTTFQSGGGGGGGGAITIMTVNDSYTGTKTVIGGTGYNGGANGLIGSNN
ncbi:MAG: prepilin-type N-terminal cleavage/methylation domain-containing protein [Candidatus Gracilibacteria bacterium]|nr:prepilin-type N-terminal cleavage/methylation domain-containing protein [Candidatus Gracilibacteria bacterium]